ncbi:MAG: hypothetical protein Q9164_006576, partial [Protoblastenia rupestris]
MTKSGKKAKSSCNYSEEVRNIQRASLSSSLLSSVCTIHWVFTVPPKIKLPQTSVPKEGADSSASNITSKTTTDVFENETLSETPMTDSQTPMKTSSLLITDFIERPRKPANGSATFKVISGLSQTTGQGRVLEAASHKFRPENPKEFFGGQPGPGVLSQTSIPVLAGKTNNSRLKESRRSHDQHLPTPESSSNTARYLVKLGLAS